MQEVPVFLVLMGATILGLAVTLVRLFSRLKKRHNELWVYLGKPGQKTFWIGFSWKLARFIFFSEDSRHLQDMKVRAYVLATRLFYVLFLALIAVRVFYGRQ